MFEKYYLKIMLDKQSSMRVMMSSKFWKEKSFTTYLEYLF